MLDPELSKAVAMEADRIAAQWLAEHASPSAAPSMGLNTEQTAAAAQQGTRGDEPADIQTIDVASLELVRPRSIGVAHLGLSAMRQVGFVELLQELGSIIGRMATPGSAAATFRWLGQHSGLGELLDVDFERMQLITLYRASDALMKRRDVIFWGTADRSP